MNNRRTDVIGGIVFLGLTLAFVGVSMNNSEIFDWAFERHHNRWSWYIRPLFLIPFCYFAYRRSFSGMMGSVFALFTSMFWFPKPAVVDPQVIEFLAFEKAYLRGEWNLSKVLLTLTIPVSFIVLGLAFWKRSVSVGLSVVVLMATGKMIWSIQNAGESGTSILVPAIAGLLVCTGLIFFGFRRLERNRSEIGKL